RESSSTLRPNDRCGAGYPISDVATEGCRSTIGADLIIGAGSAIAAVWVPTSTGGIGVSTAPAVHPASAAEARSKPAAAACRRRALVGAAKDTRTRTDMGRPGLSLGQS